LTRPRDAPQRSSARVTRRSYSVWYWFICSEQMGSDTMGCWASCVSTYAAAAMPNTAGMGPSTGMVRTRKLGTTC